MRRVVARRMVIVIRLLRVADEQEEGDGEDGGRCLYPCIEEEEED